MWLVFIPFLLFAAKVELADWQLAPGSPAPKDAIEIVSCEKSAPDTIITQPIKECNNTIYCGYFVKCEVKVWGTPMSNFLTTALCDLEDGQCEADVTKCTIQENLRHGCTVDKWQKQLMGASLQDSKKTPTSFE